MTQLHLYNTLTREKEPFAPLEPPQVRMYSCGPTVYSRQHLGNLRAYVFADLLKRSLLYFGHTVKHVINITDVGHLTDDGDDGDDKMEKAARQTGETAWDIAAKWTQVFQDDLRKLDVLAPDVWCKATDHIAEQVEMIVKLEQDGYAYVIEDGVYFDTSKDPNYGELARLQLDEQEATERIGGADHKRNRADFALWKFCPPDAPRRQMEWESPWGRGFPGWHIECSAMSTRYLGAQFDIHTGGIDHIPVHHPNEIAQSEAVLGVRPWVRFWVHGGWLMFNDEKMSKSLGRTRNLDQIIEQGVEPGAYRLFLMGAHYRQQISFGDEALASAQRSYARLRRIAADARASEESRGADQLDGLRARFAEAIADDLNSPRALAVLWEALRSDELGGVEKATLVTEFDAVLGLALEAEAKPVAQEGDSRIDALVEERLAARKAKDFARSDAIRDELLADGIVLEDGPEGTRWRRE